MPKPQKQHEWLNRFLGEWRSDVKCYMGSDEPAFTHQGSEKFRSLAGFWVLGDIQSDNTEMPFSALMTTGYDGEKDRYVGSWIDSMTNYLWLYEGSVDETGRILTLYTEGPCPMAPGRHSKFRETTEFLGADQKRFTSSILGEDGKWVTAMVVDSVRKG